MIKRLKPTTASQQMLLYRYDW